MSRDDFTEPIKRKLALRVNHRCSNPDCRAQTSGPQSDSSGTVNVGVAAHISAAAPGGPRYDAALSENERSGFDNGIWLCQNCAKHVDSDSSQFSPDRLREWKHHAEEYARDAVGKTAATGTAEAAISDKWVNMDYPKAAGITADLEKQGYQLAWASAKREALLVDVEGWEPVIVNDSNGRPAALKIKESAGGYLVLLKRRAKSDL